MHRFYMLRYYCDEQGTFREEESVLCKNPTETQGFLVLWLVYVVLEKALEEKNDVSNPFSSEKNSSSASAIILVLVDSYDL